MDMYELARGPLAWVASIVFLSGTLFRVGSFLRIRQRHGMVYPSQSTIGGIRALAHGLVPFASTAMRSHPVFTLVTVLFHVCLLLLPMFLLAHIILWYESWELLWWSLPDNVADIMTVWVILACLAFVIRRGTDSAARQVSRKSDFVLPLLILLPFLSGFLASHHWGPYRPLLILHILSGELLLMSIPFTRLGHMFYFFLARIYMGADFGRFMKAGDW